MAIDISHIEKSHSWICNACDATSIKKEKIGTVIRLFSGDGYLTRVIICMDCADELANKLMRKIEEK